jgi:uncharacterized protein (TIGR02145 family)
MKKTILDYLTFIFMILVVELLLSNSCKKEKIKEETISDVDGNVYGTIKIGNQFWMSENLRTTKYNNSVSIPFVEDNNKWKSAIEGAYCWYNNNYSNKSDYGGLYNWYTINTGKLCPTGWHVPTKSEWDILMNFLGGYTEAGGKLKEKGLTHWLSPNYGASNISGFTARPGGWRNYDYGIFLDIGKFGYWWAASPVSEISSFSFGMGCADSGLEMYPGMENHSGNSVRCIKDQ